MKHRHNKRGAAPEHLPEVINFNYDGNPVSFTVNGKVMVNATEMAKPFGENKAPGQWFRTQSFKEFIQELTVVHNCTTEKLILTKQGGAIQGTWMHEDVALEFARWLSPKFAIWCNDRIKELVKGRLPSTIDPAAFNTLVKSLHGFTEASAQGFENINRRMDEYEQRLQAVELRKEIPSGNTSEEPKHDQMDLDRISFQLPVYLNRKMKQYCVSKSITIRDFLNDLIASKLIKELKI